MRAKKLEHCGTCKFFNELGTSGDGFCLRFPMVWTGKNWDCPPASCGCYCGEWRAIPVEKKLQRTTGAVRNSTVKDV